ncbi:MAG: 5-formyltetrahydrofolate cyclo-ligase [Chlamydiia bacterium]|nr:5-formyltetrahydrofolate cyclo-ligase [Chlamydiia bacterium]
MSYKAKVRKAYLDKRRGIAWARKEEAKQEAYKTLTAVLKELSYVLSFASKKEEIDLWPLNQKLADEKRLLFPRLDASEAIVPYRVTDLKHLAFHPKWGVLEPDPALCLKCPLEKVSAVLVPGVVFDATFNRLGYGKGHYDRFLSRLSCPFLGVGFKEQLSEDPLEVEPHDVPLTDLYLF